ncbi:MAG: hypothetical protein K8R21_13045 [Leptospira sp.]|nr:hypothetical protein [Leptospira sp.]
MKRVASQLNIKKRELCKSISFLENFAELQLTDFWPSFNNRLIITGLNPIQNSCFKLIDNEFKAKTLEIYESCSQSALYFYQSFSLAAMQTGDKNERSAIKISRPKRIRNRTKRNIS